MKRIMLTSISLLLFSSLVFANDLKKIYLKGKWESSEVLCRLSNRNFIKIGVRSKAHYYALEFKNDNKVVTIVKFSGCEMINTGTYLVKNTSLTIYLESTNMYALLPFLQCKKFPGGEVISYNEIILRNGSLYLEDSEPSDFLRQKCIGGTVFERLIRTNTI